MVIKGWSKIPLSNIADFQGGSQPPLFTFSTRRLPDYIRLLQIRDYKTDKYCIYIPTVLAKRFCNADDIMIGRYGPPIFQILRGLSGAYNVALIKAVPKNVDRNFLYYTLKRADLFKYIDALSRRTSGQTGIDLNNLREFELSIPNVIAEQTAIAEALSDADGLIASLQKLIAKKKAIKQGAMQELLTGKKRLPGFSGEWVELNLASKSKLKARIGWQGLTTTEYLIRGFAYLITGTDFKGGKISWDNCHYVEKWRYDQDSNIQIKNGDVLITKDGTIGKVAYVHELDSPATLNSGVFVVRPINETAYYSEFLYHVLNSFIFEDFLERLSAGSTINHLYQKDFIDFCFNAPAMLKEQTAIAQVLSDMDAEIEQLEKKLSKYQQIKQGMMQELLTGRIRLVEPAREDIFTLVSPPANYLSSSEYSKKDFDDAVTISVIAKIFYKPKIALGRKRGHKLFYLLCRRQGADISNFKMHPAGPYDSRIRYDIEPIAEKLHFIQAIGRNDSTKFQPGDKVEVAMRHAEKSCLAADIQWLKSEFEYTGVDDLEVLATVDMARYKLEHRSEKATLSSVKKFIQSVPEWAPKLEKAHFNDANIIKAINQSRKLFSSGTK